METKLWQHHCVKEGLISLQEGEPCSWCGKEYRDIYEGLTGDALIKAIRENVRKNANPNITDD